MVIVVIQSVSEDQTTGGYWELHKQKKSPSTAMQIKANIFYLGEQGMIHFDMVGVLESPAETETLGHKFEVSETSSRVT